SSTLRNLNITLQTLPSFTGKTSQFDDTNANRVKFTIENVLDRYGGLRNICCYLFAYSFIVFATQLFINIWSVREDESGDCQAHLNETRGSPLCCCRPPLRLRRLSNGLKEMYLDTKQMEMWYAAAFLVSAVLCSLLERIGGRRRLVLISLPLSAVSLSFLAVIRDEKTIRAIVFIASMANAV
ncbi:hypothetical protein PMAYCL1PPCAC_13337, partial [Pristionchus mayeri]